MKLKQVNEIIQKNSFLFSNELNQAIVWLKHKYEYARRENISKNNQIGQLRKANKDKKKKIQELEAENNELKFFEITCNCRKYKEEAEEYKCLYLKQVNLECEQCGNKKECFDNMWGVIKGAGKQCSAYKPLTNITIKGEYQMFVRKLEQIHDNKELLEE